MNLATSLYLDIIRLLLSVVVLLSHFSYSNLSGGKLISLSKAGGYAVDIFFVLSGFVIAHVYKTRERDAINYFISRAARIYSVALPALMLTFILDYIGTNINREIYYGPYQTFSPGLVVRSLLFIGEQWNVHRFPGSNGPYWSLGFEVWYYIAFGVFAFGSRKYKWLLLVLIFLFIGPKVLLMFPVWLIGAGGYYLLQRFEVGKYVGLLISILSIWIIFMIVDRNSYEAAAFFDLNNDPARYLAAMKSIAVALLFILHIIGFNSFVVLKEDKLDRLKAPIRWISGATFSIYLAHLPIMYFLFAIFPKLKSENNCYFIIPPTLIGCFLFAEIGERRKTFWRNLFSKVWQYIIYRLTTATSK